MDPNRVILQETLRNRFNLVIFSVNKYGEEKYGNFKMTKKKFLETLGDGKIRARLVDEYPKEIEDDIFYVRKDGRTVWIREVLVDEV